MKRAPTVPKKLQHSFFAVLVAVSLVLMAFDWIHLKDIFSQLAEDKWTGFFLVLTEGLFIAGALLMAVSTGESLAGFKRLHHWPKHIITLRRNARVFAERLIVSKMFTIGFWLNFIGAVGTSLILLTAILTLIPYRGFGIAVVIVVDLIATFGWRIPLEIARRKAQQNGIN